MTGAGMPVYWLGGSRIADDYGDFYDGSWDDVTGRRTETGGASAAARIWTGANSDGTADTRHVLGADAVVFRVTSTGTAARARRAKIASAPESGDSYGSGETTTVRVTMSEPVRVMGSPHIWLEVGDERRQAVYAGAVGEAVTALDFSYAAQDGTPTRVRLALEGSRPVRLGETTLLTPSLEVGVRHDGGDAETGFGADIGAGLAIADGARGVSAELRARGLLTHEAGGMRERGLSGTLSFDPAPETERGLSLSLTQTMGGQASGGASALLERSTFAGLGAEEDEGLSARRLDTRIGYGFGVLDECYTAIPEFGLGLSDTGRELRLGWRLAERVSSGFAFELGLEGTRREFADSKANIEHGVVAGAGWRLMSRGAESFEVRLEASRHEASNDDGPEHTIGVRLGASW